MTCDLWLRRVGLRGGMMALGLLALGDLCDWYVSGRAFAADSVPRITDVVRDQAGVRFRVQGAERYRVEVSTNLTVWEGVGERQVSEFVDSGWAGWPRRFYRVAGLGEGARLRFVEPQAGAMVTTQRPRIELETPPVGLGGMQMRLTVNGADVAFELSLVTTGRVALVPVQALGDGWQTVVATWREGTNVAALAARTEFAVRQVATNLPPVAREDNIRVAGGETRVVLPLVNDVDPEGGPLSVEEVGGAVGGLAELRGGLVTYTAKPDFLGEDELRYVVADAQGLRSTGRVAVLVRPAADMTVILTDAVSGVAGRLRFEPGAGNPGEPGSGASGLHGEPAEFRTLDEAVAAICRVLQPGQRGRIRVRARQPIQASRVWFDCPIDIEAEEGHRPRLEGETIEFGGGGDLALVGLTLGAGQTMLAVGHRLDLIGNEFAGGLTVRLNAAPAPVPLGGGVEPGRGMIARMAQAGAGAVEEVESRGNSVRGRYEVSGEAGDGSRIEHRGDNAAVLGFDGRVGLRGRYVVDGAVVADRLVLRAQAEAGAEFEANGVAGVSAVEHRLVANGEIATRLRGVVAGRAELEFAGVGKVVGSARAVRADRIDYRLGAADIEHSGADTVTGDLSIEVAPIAGAAVRANVAEADLRVAADMNVVTAENVRATVGVEGGRVGNGFLARLDGEATVRLGGGLAVGGDAYVEARGSVTRVESREVTFGARFEARHEVGVAAFLQFDGTVHHGDVEVGAVQTGTVGLDVGGAVFNGGAKLIRALSGSRRAAHEPAGFGMSLMRAARRAQPSERVVIRNTRFLGDSAGPRVYLEGTRDSVLIEGCDFAGRPQAVVINEPEGAVTIRGNRMAGEGVMVDGDVEGGGLPPGVRATPVTIAGNEWSGVRLQPALAVQDLSRVTVVSNVIRGATGIAVTAGRAVLEGNELDLDSGLPAVLATRGPGGPGYVVARGNRVTAILGVQVLDGSYGEFDGNTFVGGRLAGLTIPPIPTIPGLPGLPDLPGLPGDDDPGDGDGGGEDEEGEPNMSILVGDGVKLAAGFFTANSFSNVTVQLLTSAFVRLLENRFDGLTTVNVMGLFGGAQAEIRGNTFAGEASAIVVTGGVAEVVANRFGGLVDLGIGGPLAPALARIQGNSGGEVDLNVGLGGYTFFSGNSFGGGIVGDGEGYLLNDPGGNGVPGEEIQSKVNFDGDGEGCRDYPSPQICPADADESPCCNGPGVGLRSAPGGLEVVGWPAPPVF